MHIPVRASSLAASGRRADILWFTVSDSVRLRQDIAWREIDGEIVLLDLTGAAYYSVSRSGVVLWPAVVEGATVAALSERLAQEYSLERQVAERDVRVLIDSLSGEGLLEEPAA
jgi:hypothetical protein